MIKAKNIKCFSIKKPESNTERSILTGTIAFKNKWITYYEKMLPLTLIKLEPRMKFESTLFYRENNKAETIKNV